jgi:hypothetical protein
MPYSTTPQTYCTAARLSTFHLLFCTAVCYYLAIVSCVPVQHTVTIAPHVTMPHPTLAHAPISIQPSLFQDTHAQGNLRHKGPLLPPPASPRSCRGLLVPQSAALCAGADIYVNVFVHKT